jgi:hypothetical protein
VNLFFVVLYLIALGIALFFLNKKRSILAQMSLDLAQRELRIEALHSENLSISAARRDAEDKVVLLTDQLSKLSPTSLSTEEIAILNLIAKSDVFELWAETPVSLRMTQVELDHYLDELEAKKMIKKTFNFQPSYGVPSPTHFLTLQPAGRTFLVKAKKNS